MLAELVRCSKHRFASSIENAHSMLLYIEPMDLLRTLARVQALEFIHQPARDGLALGSKENRLDAVGVDGSTYRCTLTIQSFLHLGCQIGDVVRERKVLFFGDPQAPHIDASGGVLLPLKHLADFGRVQYLFPCEAQEVLTGGFHGLVLDTLEPDLSPNKRGIDGWANCSV